MKRILGLDLGANSIGWAVVNEAENCDEKSSIIRLGVRVNPLTVDEKNNFESGKSITTQADRRTNRSARRNLQRYKLRRECLREVLIEGGVITPETVCAEQGKGSTHETYRLRAKAVTEPVTLEEFARILFAINKKRGYKSNRKANKEDGVAIDSMSVAKELYDREITPGHYCYELLQKGKKKLPDFYRSDLQVELDKIWSYQRCFYPDIFTDQLQEQLVGKSQQQSVAIMTKCGINLAENKGKEKKLQYYKWRSEAISNKLDIGEVALVICMLNGEINASSGYLGNIGDRSKKLYFNQQTIGQYLYNLLCRSRHNSLKNLVFYRQDYLDEFEAVWQEQSKYHPELTYALKKKVRDTIIFYQRPLKSAKGLVSICELEGHIQEIDKDGKKVLRTVGPKVSPKSSPIFQEFKIRQRLNDTRLTEIVRHPITHRIERIVRELSIEEKNILCTELSIVGGLEKEDVLKLLFGTAENYDLNFKEYDGNKTFSALFAKYRQIAELAGGNMSKCKTAREKIEAVERVFDTCSYETRLLHFDSSLPSHDCYLQPAYMLWHLLYSYEGDNSKSGIEGLIRKIMELTRMEREYAAMIAGVSFESDYGSLSNKAMLKILPFMKDGNDYSVACCYAGYRHSRNSLTKEENENRPLKAHLDILPRNALHNPVVEKILNQMVHVVNAVIDRYGPLDEIRVEMAREIKSSAQEREDKYKAMNDAAHKHEAIRKILREEFHIEHPSRNDIIRYKLYEELDMNGHKTLYTDTYIPRESIFSKEFDIEHIIPKARLFDDSFSNKTLEVRKANIEKGDMTAYDYVATLGAEALTAYEGRVDYLYKKKKISEGKWKKLRMKQADIPDDFIDRDLRNTQYIARYAMSMLRDVVRVVVPTVGAVTSRLREDWQLVDVMKELNREKYERLGLVEYYRDKDGRLLWQIKDWSKRNDHRHHAMDALTVAFTKSSYVQYLNNLNARSDKSSSIYAIEKAELSRSGNGGQLRFNPPIPDFRREALRHLQTVLVSIKAKNKVVTLNLNKTKCRGSNKGRMQLTPRGSLHKETVYGMRRQVSVITKTIGAAFTADVIQRVTNRRYREALLQRLAQFDGDAKKAFTGKNRLDKNPVYCDEAHRQAVPMVVKIFTYEVIYTVRKSVADKLNIEKVVDSGIRKKLQEHIDKYGEASFSDLETHPIYLDEEKGITIKKVTVKGLNNAVPLHDKCDYAGRYITDAAGRRIPADYVSTGNNHHVAIFRDADGKLQEHIVSFMEAVARCVQGLPVVDKAYNREVGWTFLFTMKQNEYFLFPDEKSGFNPQEIDLSDPENYARISPHLFRVQKLATKNYMFRHHLETTVNEEKQLKNITWRLIQNTAALEGIVKVRINHIGEIIYVGEE